MGKRIAAAVLLAFFLLTLGETFALAQQKEGYLQQLVGETVNVQFERGSKSGWLQGVVLKEVHPDGIVIIYKDKEQFIQMVRLISVQKTR